MRESVEDTKLKQETSEIGLGDIMGALWRSLKSTRTTFYLLVIIALAGVVGILVPQGGEAEMYTKQYGEFLGALILRTGADHVFTTSWFIVLMALLIISSAACAKRIWKLGLSQVAGPSLDLLRRGMEEDGSPRAESVIPGDLTTTEATVTRGLTRRRYRVESVSDGDTRWLVGRKNRWGGFGVTISHIAILAIALGAVIGIVPGLKLEKEIYITEGETYRDVQHDPHEDPHMEGETHHHAKSDFDFGIKLNSFALEYYPDGVTVKAYKSDLSILEGDREVKRQTVMVNRPLSYKHIDFYQSSWGIGGLRIKVTQPGQQPEILEFPLTEAAMDGGGASVYVAPREDAVRFTRDESIAIIANRFTPDAWEEKGEVVGSRSSAMNNPAAQITVLSGFNKGGHHLDELGWIKPGKPVTAGGATIELLSAQYYTGISARRDYGVPLVWLGFVLLTIGLSATFYFSPHTIIAGLRSVDGGTTLRLLAFRKGGPGGARWSAEEHPAVAQLIHEVAPSKDNDSVPSVTG